MTQFTEIYQAEIAYFWPDQPPPCKKVRLHWCDPTALDNPFSKFVGNKHAVRRLCRAAFQTFARFNRECSDHSFALIGPASTGKATLARMFGELVCLPFVEIDARFCNDLNDIAVAMAKVLESTKIENKQYPTLELQDLGGGELVVPPCVVFIDNAHSLPKTVEQELRRAVAGEFTTNGWKFDSRAICWIVATTDEDTLSSGFDRLTRIQMKPLSVEEVAKVVALHNPDLPADVCRFISQHAPLPRSALTFAGEMRVEFEMNRNGDWKKVAVTVAKDWGVQDSTPWLNRVSRNGRY